MLFSVRDLELKPIRFDQTYAAGEIDFLEEGLTQVGPLSAKGEAELQESVGEIEVRGELHMRLASECDRCLERAEFGMRPSSGTVAWVAIGSTARLAAARAPGRSTNCRACGSTAARPTRFLQCSNC